MNDKRFKTYIIQNLLWFQASTIITRLFINAMLKFHKYSKISERDLKSSLQVAANFIS